MRVTDIAITPDFTRLVAVGMSDTPPTPATVNPTPPDAVTPPVGTTTAANAKKPENRFIVYDLTTKQVEQYVSISFLLTCYFLPSLYIPLRFSSVFRMPRVYSFTDLYLGPLLWMANRRV